MLLNALPSKLLQTDCWPALHRTRLSGKLTATELINESGLRRDVVYEHRDLVDDFKAQVKARHSVPEVAQKMADHAASLEAELKDAKADLQRERDTNAYLRRVITELSIELEQSRQQGTIGLGVTPLVRHPVSSREPH